MEPSPHQIQLDNFSKLYSNYWSSYPKKKSRPTIVNRESISKVKTFLRWIIPSLRNRLFSHLDFFSFLVLHDYILKMFYPRTGRDTFPDDDVFLESVQFIPVGPDRCSTQNLRGFLEGSRRDP